MSINVKLLAEICEAAGAPGHEQRIREIVIREVSPFVDEKAYDVGVTGLDCEINRRQSLFTSRVHVSPGFDQGVCHIHHAHACSDVQRR